MPSTRCTRTWPRDTALASVRSRSAQSLFVDLLTRQIIRVAEIEKTSDVRRANIKQLLAPKLRFPLPHRLVKSRSLFTAKRPSTF